MLTKRLREFKYYPHEGGEIHFAILDEAADAIDAAFQKGRLAGISEADQSTRDGKVFVAGRWVARPDGANLPMEWL